LETDLYNNYPTDPQTLNLTVPFTLKLLPQCCQQGGESFHADPQSGIFPENVSRVKKYCPQTLCISSPSIFYFLSKNFSGLKRGPGEENYKYEEVSKFGSVTVQ
jgi:hypothetical protein